MKIRIVSAVFFLFSMFLPLQAFADVEYPACKGETGKIELNVENPAVEIQLRPDCWSSEVVINRRIKQIRTIYIGKGEIEYRWLVALASIDNVPVAVTLGDRFRARGNGTLTIRAISYIGADI